MEMLVDRNLFLQAMQTAGRFISAKSPIPILAGVKITAGDGQLTIETTDLEKGAKVKVAANVVEPGEVVIPARILTNLFSHFQDGVVFLEKDGDTRNMKVKCGGSETVISGYPPEEYPQPPEAEPEECAVIHIPSDIFKRAVRQTAYAASRNESQPIFKGVFFKTSGANLEMAATDTHRLAWFRTSLELINVEAEVVIPSHVLNEISKIVSHDEVEIILSRSHAFFNAGDINVMTRLVSGRHPDVRTVIPEGRAASFKVSVKEMLSVMRRVLALLDYDNAPVNMIVGPGGVALRSESASYSINEETPAEAVDGVDGGERSIALNCKYLAEALSVIHTDEIIIGITGDMSPITIEPAGEEGCLSLLMPVALRR